MTITELLALTLGVAITALLLFPLFLVWVGEEQYKPKHPSFARWLINSVRP